MNYEELYAEYLNKEKELRDRINSQQKIFKRLTKEMESGDIKTALKDLAALSEAVQGTEQVNASINELVQSFDIYSYVKNGEFAEQMLSYCEKAGVDAKGENNVYELFPYKVKLDGENADIYLDRKKAPYLRPQSLVEFIKSQRDRLMNAFFNPAAFAEELAQAYDLSIIVQSGGKREVAPDSDVYLTGLYKYLTPMKRFRRDYDAQGFAFDIARLFSSDVTEISGGRKFQFGPSRKNEKAIRVLDNNSQEHFLATVRFYNE